MKVWPKQMADEPGEALRFDGSKTSAAAIVAFCGPAHAEFDEASGALAIGEPRRPVPSPGWVVNPYRGGFEVLTEPDFSAAWEAE